MLVRSSAFTVVVLVVACGAVAGQMKLSQSVAPNTITVGNSISCNVGAGIHGDNSYIRFYNPVAEGETSATITITGIRYGVEAAVAGGGAGAQPLFVNVFQVPTGATAFSSFTLLQQEAVMQPDVGGNGAFFTVQMTPPLSYTNNPAFDLAIEVFTPDGQPQGHSFFIGSNTAGQTAPSYIAAAGCSFPNPTDLAAIGFPNMHVVIDVCYTPGMPPPLTYPGTSALSGDDFDCLFDVGQTGTLTLVDGANEQFAVNPGDNVEVVYRSPSGALAGIGDYFAVGSLVTTGTVIPDAAPGASIYVGGTLFVFDGFRDVFGFPVHLPLAGSATNFSVPPGLSGMDAVLQGFVLGTAAANGVYASSNGLTITFN